MKSIVLLVLILLYIGDIKADLVFATPSVGTDGLELPTFPTPPMLFAVTEFNITAPLLYLVSSSVYQMNHFIANFASISHALIVNPKDTPGCLPLDVDATGMIVAVRSFGGCFPSTKARVAQEAGAVGVLIGLLGGNREGDVPGSFARYPPEVEGPFTVPAVQISFRFGALVRDLIAQNETIIVTITPSSNPWLETFDSPGFIFFQVLFAAIFLTILSIGIWKLVVVVQSQGWSPSILQVFVWIEIISSALRFLYFLDPMQSRGLFSVIPAFLFGTVHIPLTYIAAVLIALYWMETVSDYISPKPKTKWLTKMAIPFYIFMALVLISYIAYIVAEYYGLSSTTIQGLILVNFIFIAFASIFILAVGGKVLHFARKMDEKLGQNASRNKAVKMMTVKLILSGVGMLVMLILSPLLGAPTAAVAFGPINAWLALIIEQFVCLALVSLAQLLTIQGKKKWTSNETKSGSKPSVTSPPTTSSHMQEI